MDRRRGKSFTSAENNLSLVHIFNNHDNDYEENRYLKSKTEEDNNVT